MTSVILPPKLRVRQDRQCAGPKCGFRKAEHGDQCSCYLGLLAAATIQHDREQVAAYQATRAADAEATATLMEENRLDRKSRKKIEAGQASLF
jgi:hypothetical protein